MIFDGTVLIASNGTLLAENRRFSYRAVNLVTAIADLRANRLERRRISYPVARDEANRAPVHVPFAPVEASPESRPRLRPTLQTSKEPSNWPQTWRAAFPLAPCCS